MRPFGGERLLFRCIKTVSETRIRVVCRAKSRFPRLLERLRKRETEWTDWKEASRAQGRCAMRPRYAVRRSNLAPNGLYELLYELLWKAMRNAAWSRCYNIYFFNDLDFPPRTASP